jgi:hypothetical protein
MVISERRVTGAVEAEMCIVLLSADILVVQGWWLPRSGNTKLDRAVYGARTTTVEWSGEVLFVCLFAD